MDQRRWEDLNKDCLMNVFDRVGMESLLLDIPFVCKSWHATSLDPSCWQSLIFPDYSLFYYLLRRSFIHENEINERSDSFLKRFVHEYGINESCFSTTAFIKFVVNRRGGHAKIVELPRSRTVAALKHVADVCPGLKALSLPSDEELHEESSIVPQLIGNWKDLESLSLGSNNYLVKLLSQISIHCNKFSHLTITSPEIGNDEASAILNFVPRIKHLNLSYAHIPRQCLVELLQGCKELLTLDVSGCTGFDERDDEILKLASHITTFSCEGSSTHDYDYGSDGSYFYGYDDDGYGSDKSYNDDDGYGSDESYNDDDGYGSDESYYDDYGYGYDFSVIF